MVHYFPLPFILMALAGYVIDLNLAFNLGTMFGTVVLPFVVYFSFRIMSFKFPTPIITSLFTIPYLYNESYSIFGGNFLSTLSGQFAHAYAVNFLILAISFIVRSIKKNQFSIVGIILLSMSALSHAYVFMITPFFFLSILPLANKSELKSWLKIFFLTGLFALLTTSWFIWPMIDHQAWMTHSPMVFGKSAFREVFASKILYPFFILSLFSCLMLIRHNFVPFFKNTFVWVFPAIVYLALFFILPKVGLVDARALPQTLLFILIAGGLFTSFFIQNFKLKIFELIIIPIVGAVVITWTISQVTTLSHWMKWNYSSWIDKKHYPYLQSISNSLRGELDMPRVIYEHHPDLNRFGTTRVFEMLPYFAKRSTMEGLYLQSSLLTPVSLYLQSKISEKPSCAVKEYRCSDQNFKTLEEKMDLTAVDSIIVYTDNPKKDAKFDRNFKFHSDHGPYSIYKLIQTPKYAVPLTGNAFIINYKKDWKLKMYDWFIDYDGSNDWLVVDLPWLDNEKFKSAIESNRIKNCDTNIKVDFDGFDFKTDCVGVPHLLKFAYSDSWKNSTNSPMYLLAPGMFGFIPSNEITRFDFGQKLSWKVANYVSLFSLILLFIVRRKI